MQTPACIQAKQHACALAPRGFPVSDKRVMFWGWTDMWVQSWRLWFPVLSVIVTGLGSMNSSRRLVSLNRYVSKGLQQWFKARVPWDRQQPNPNVNDWCESASGSARSRSAAARNRPPRAESLFYRGSLPTWRRSSSASPAVYSLCSASGTKSCKWIEVCSSRSRLSNVSLVGLQAAPQCQSHSTSLPIHQSAVLMHNLFPTRPMTYVFRVGPLIIFTGCLFDQRLGK